MHGANSIVLVLGTFTPVASWLLAPALMLSTQGSSRDPQSTPEMNSCYPTSNLGGDRRKPEAGFEISLPLNFDI